MTALREHERPLPSPSTEPGTAGRTRAAATAISAKAPQLLAVAATCVLVVLAGILGVTADGTGVLQPVDTALSSMLTLGGAHAGLLARVLSSPVAPAVAAIGITLFWGRRWWPRWSAVALTAGAGLTAWTIRALVARPGPGHLGDLAAASSTSFPSVAAAMFAALGYASVRSRLSSASLPRWRAAAVGAALAIVAALPALLTASVWPSDVVAGVALGLAITQLAEQPQPRLRRLARSAPRGAGWVALACAALLLSPAAVSYTSLLAAPGNAPFGIRTVEWLRDHHLSSIVDHGESWWLWRHLPSTTATITALPAAPLAGATPAPVPSRPAPGTPASPRPTSTATRSAAPATTAPAAAPTTSAAPPTTVPANLPAPIPPPLQPPLAGEGSWTVAVTDQRGVPQLETASFRPDPQHPSVVAGVAWINSTNTRISLIAGTRQPPGGVGPAGGRVPDAARGALIAAFNSGYKMQDTPGGALIEGRLTGRLAPGVATLAVRPDGTATVGEWGKDLDPNAGFVAVRQNLHLLVADGLPAPGLATNAGGFWGSVKNILPTWRSGVGVTARGDLVYVAGNNLTLGVLADALIRAGATNAMELDIHQGMVTFNLFTHDNGLVGHKLLPDMPRAADRYLTPDWRDFVMVTSR